MGLYTDTRALVKDARFTLGEANATMARLGEDLDRAEAAITGAALVVCLAALAAVAVVFIVIREGMSDG